MQPYVVEQYTFCNTQSALVSDKDYTNYDYSYSTYPQAPSSNTHRHPSMMIGGKVKSHLKRVKGAIQCSCLSLS